MKNEKKQVGIGTSHEILNTKLRRVTMQLEIYRQKNQKIDPVRMKTNCKSTTKKYKKSKKNRPVPQQDFDLVLRLSRSIAIMR